MTLEFYAAKIHILLQTPYSFRKTLQIALTDVFFQKNELVEYLKNAKKYELFPWILSYFGRLFPWILSYFSNLFVWKKSNSYLCRQKIKTIVYVLS